MSNQLPLWQCHRRVRAAKIEAIERNKKFGAVLKLEGGLEVEVNRYYIEQYAPSVGGYYTTTKDGKVAWYSAQVPFERDHEVVEEAKPHKVYLVKIGVSHDPVPMSQVKKGDLYRIFDIAGNQIDQFVRQAIGDAVVSEDGIAFVPHQKVA